MFFLTCSCCEGGEMISWGLGGPIIRGLDRFIIFINSTHLSLFSWFLSEGESNVTPLSSSKEATSLFSMLLLSCTMISSLVGEQQTRFLWHSMVSSSKITSSEVGKSL